MPFSDLLQLEFVINNQDSIRDQLQKLLPPIAHDQRQLALDTYRLLADKASPVSFHELKQFSSYTEIEIENILSNWPDLRLDKENNIEAFAGLSTIETSHQIIINSKKLYTWCAWDTLFISALLGSRTQIKSTCPVTNSSLEFEIQGYELIKQPKEQAVLSFIIPSRDFCLKNVQNQFCCHIHFFKNVEVAKQWQLDNPESLLISVEAGIELGRMQNTIRYG